MGAGSLAWACREPNEGQRLLECEAGDIELADLLGRTQVDTDVESIAGYLTYRRALVTGAGSSIVSERDVVASSHRYM